jgi:hypothetical protein
MVETKFVIPPGIFNASSSNLGMSLGCEADECPQICLSNEFKLWCFICKILTALQDFPDAFFFVMLHLWLLHFAIVDYLIAAASSSSSNLAASASCSFDLANETFLPFGSLSDSSKNPRSNVMWAAPFCLPT